jgi:DNA-binding CsgD family transcriptional regulator
MGNRSRHYQTRHKHDLTPRQRTVLELMAEGRTNAEIAARLGLTLDGAKWHVSEILSRLSLSSREEAIVWWHEYHRWPAKVSRRLALLAMPGAWKIAAATGGAAAAAAAVAITIVAFRPGGDLAAKDPYPACASENIRWDYTVETTGAVARVDLSATLREPDWYEGFLRSVGLSDRHVASPCQLSSDVSYELVRLIENPERSPSGAVVRVPAELALSVDGNPVVVGLEAVLETDSLVHLASVELENWCAPLEPLAVQFMVPASRPGGPPTSHAGATIPIPEGPPCSDPARPPALKAARLSSP